MTDDILKAGPVRQLLDDVDMADDARLATALESYRMRASAEPPTPSPEVARLLSRRVRTRTRVSGRPGARTTTLVLLIAALGGGASAAAAANPALHAIVRDALSSLSPHEHAGPPIEHPGTGTRTPVNDTSAGTGRKPAQSGPLAPPTEKSISGPSDPTAATTDSSGQEGQQKPTDTKGTTGAAEPTAVSGSEGSPEPQPAESPAPTKDRNDDPTTSPRPVAPGGSDGSPDSVESTPSATPAPYQG